MKCNNCSENVKYVCTLKKGDMYVRMYRCVKCQQEYPFEFYGRSPNDGHKHEWEFYQWGHDDNGDAHSIYWIMKCCRCGLENKEMRHDSYAVGLREAVDLEDPRVLNLLEVKHETAKFHFDEDEVMDFWQ